VFKENRPLLTHVDTKTRASVLSALPSYLETLQFERRHFISSYQLGDLAFKIVGTGSIGTRDYVVLGNGNFESDVLFLQIKEEPASAWAPYLKSTTPKNEGQRVVEGQRLLQAQSDI